MQQDYKTLAIYVLTLFVVVLLIVLKKQQDHLTELESEVVETEALKTHPDSLRRPLWLNRPLGPQKNQFYIDKS